MRKHAVGASWERFTTACSRMAAQKVWHITEYFHATRDLVREVVNEVIHPDAVGQRRQVLRIAGIVGMLPGIAQVHVAADGNDDAAFLIGNGAPQRIVTVV